MSLTERMSGEEGAERERERESWTLRVLVEGIIQEQPISSLTGSSAGNDVMNNTTALSLSSVHLYKAHLTSGPSFNTAFIKARNKIKTKQQTWWLVWALEDEDCEDYMITLPGWETPPKKTQNN